MLNLIVLVLCLLWLIKYHVSYKTSCTKPMTETNYWPSRFSMTSMLFKARFKYSSFFKRPRFSVTCQWKQWNLVWILTLLLKRWELMYSVIWIFLSCFFSQVLSHRAWGWGCFAGRGSSGPCTTCQCAQSSRCPADGEKLPPRTRSHTHCAQLSAGPAPL